MKKLLTALMISLCLTNTASAMDFDQFKRIVNLADNTGRTLGYGLQCAFSLSFSEGCAILGAPVKTTGFYAVKKDSYNNNVKKYKTQNKHQWCITSDGNALYCDLVFGTDYTDKQGRRKEKP